MQAEGIDAILWKACGKSDLRALLGRGGGHEVIAWGKLPLWNRILGVTVNEESAGGTRLGLIPEDGVDPDASPLVAYRASGRNNEIRVKVPPLIDDSRWLVDVAQSNAAAVDPDGNPTDELVALLILTTDGAYHLRGALKSNLPAVIADQIGTRKLAGGSAEFSGVTLTDLEREVWNALIEHRNVLLYGPAGTGKTRLMQRVKAAFEWGRDGIVFDPTDKDRPLKEIDAGDELPDGEPMVRFTTFHQSLTYENFVVGLQPSVSGSGKGAGTLTFAVKSGVFLQLAAHALDGGKSLLLVDEFNRGNVADILGELITIIEIDKRLDEGGEEDISTVVVTLPHEPADLGLEQEFAMPSPLYLLASMNSLDRSVAPIDSALRRRFRMIHVEPRSEVLQEVLLAGGAVPSSVADPAAPTADEVAGIAIRMLEQINEHIRAFWGPEFCIGHSYFLSATTADRLAKAYNEAVLPQLIELYRDAPQALAELLGAGPDVPSTVALASQPAGSGADSLAGTPSLDTRTLDPYDTPDVVRRLHWLGSRDELT